MAAARSEKTVRRCVAGGPPHSWRKGAHRNVVRLSGAEVDALARPARGR